MTAIDSVHLVTCVIRPALRALAAPMNEIDKNWRGVPHTRAAEKLLLLTAASESFGGKYLKQLGDGPALGVFQMEPATHSDLVTNFLAYRKPLRASVILAAGMARTPKGAAEKPDSALSSETLVYNLRYAAAMTRVHYYRRPFKMPEDARIDTLAEIWKEHYNTKLGKGTPEGAIAKSREAIANAARLWREPVAA